MTRDDTIVTYCLNPNVLLNGVIYVSVQKNRRESQSSRIRPSLVALLKFAFKYVCLTQTCHRADDIMTHERCQVSYLIRALVRALSSARTQFSARWDERETRYIPRAQLTYINESCREHDRITQIHCRESVEKVVWKLHKRSLDWRSISRKHTDI